MRPSDWKRGDLIRTDRLNGVTSEARLGRQSVVVGSGTAIVGTNHGVRAAHFQKQAIHLVEAIEDFASGYITDNYLAADVIPSGKCRLLQLELTTGTYAIDPATEPFVVYDPLSVIGDSDSKASGDKFYCVWNRDNQRAEVVSGGGGGAKAISFAIVSTDYSNRSALVEIRQRTFSGQVFGSILDDTVVTVYDTDGCFLNEPSVDLTGRLGKAMLFIVDGEAIDAHFKDDGDYSPKKYWNVFNLCCPHNECD